MDFNFRSLALYAAQRLMDHHIGVQERETLARRTGSEKDGCHAGAGADADGRHIRTDVLHGVINSKARGDDASRAVDIEVNVFRRIFSFQEKELGNDDVCHMIPDFTIEENDSVFQKTGINIIGTFSLCGLFHYDRYISHK